jgi:hypothetical protein
VSQAAPVTAPTAAAYTPAPAAASTPTPAPAPTPSVATPAAPQNIGADNGVRWYAVTVGRAVGVFRDWSVFFIFYFLSIC